MYWPDLAEIRDNRLGLGRITLNFRQGVVTSMELTPNGQYQLAISRKSKKSLEYLSFRAPPVDADLIEFGVAVMF